MNENTKPPATKQAEAPTACPHGTPHRWPCDQCDAPTASNAERSPKDFAIEHAEYMATSAVHLIAAVNDLAKAEQENEDGLAEQSDVDAARDTLTERVTALRDGIYEFRKRRDRAALATQQEAQPQAVARWNWNASKLEWLVPYEASFHMKSLYFAPPARAAQDLEDAFNVAMKETWQMINPLAPSGDAGSYARGEYNGIVAALKTFRENFERAARAAQQTTGERG